MSLVRRGAFVVSCLAVACGGNPEVEREQGVCDAFGFTDRGHVRAFVVGHKQLVADAESYASFEASYRRHLEAIEPCLSADRPNLIVFPENAALGAFVLGSRAQQARAAKDSLSAFVEVLVAYPDQFAHYKAEYPTLTLRRHILLALTDVTWRAFSQTFGGIAKDHGVWVMANADVAPAKSTTDAALVEKLGDPEAADPSVAFVASEPNAYNSAYLFDPSGEVAGRVDKAFLVDAEEIDLELVNGSFSQMPVLETPFARIGVATSRDAFYPPFMQRLEDLDADLVVQPEAFSGWTVEQLPGDWLPDVFLSSGWLHTQKYATFRHSLNPVYTGNFFDLEFDGQAHITERARPGQALGAYVGQEPLPGFTRVGPWVEPDPGALAPELSLDERRAKLRETGEALLPGSGAPTENGYVDSLVAADLELPSAAEAKPVKLERDASLPESRAVAESDAGHQRAPDVAADAKGAAVVVWQDSRSGAPRIFAARSSDAGASFGEPFELEAGGSAPQRRPRVCSDGTRFAVVWQEGAPGKEQIRAALAPSAGAAFEKPLAVAKSAGAQWWADCGFVGAGELAVVWSDFASGVAKLRFARRAAGQAAFEAALVVDPTSDAEPRLDGTQVEADISQTGGHVVWLDYRAHAWDVYVTRFDGTGFTPSRRVDTAPAGAESERLNGEPRVEADGARVLVTWSDLRDRRGHSDISYSLSTDGGATFGERKDVPGGVATGLARSSGGTAMPRYRPAVALRSDGADLVFQDLSLEKSAIFASALTAAGEASAPKRLDDTANAPVSLKEPRVARAGAALLVVWSDDRLGPSRIYTSRVE